MKKSFSNKLTLVLVLIFLATSISACGVPGNVNTTTEAPTDAATDAPTDAHTDAPTDAPTEAPTYELTDGSPLTTLPEYTYDPWEKYWDMEKGAEMLLFKAESGDGYTQYLNDLEGAGFTLYAENDIVDNRFSTWVNDELHVTMMYLPSQNSVRILAEPSSVGLPTREEDNVYTDAGVENVMVQMGTSYDSNTNNGMCYIYRLCDGSFIIVDAGFNESVCADELYNTLVKLAPDENNIVIAAWFITHAHTDHVGGFYQFTDKYVSGKSNITLEQMIYNYPTENSFNLSGTSTNHISKIENYISKYPNEVSIVEAHPGQKFYIRDAEVEMLYTWDMFNTKSIIYMNNSSLLFSVTLGDTKIIMTGDCGPLAAPIIEQCYGEYVACDIIQVAHHGTTGSSMALNALYQADIVLWPTTYSMYGARKGGGNAVFGEATYQYVADDDAWMIPLPFDPERVENWPLYGSENN